VKLQEIHKR